MEETTDKGVGGLAGQGYRYPRLSLSQETLIISEEYYENRVGDLAAYVPVSSQYLSFKF